MSAVTAAAGTVPGTAPAVQQERFTEVGTISLSIDGVDFSGNTGTLTNEKSAGATVNQWHISHLANRRFLLTAKIQDGSGNPVVGKQVTFAVIAGPNMDTAGNGVTGSKGQVTFSSVGNVVGTDTIIASFVDNAGKTFPSNEVMNKWEHGMPVPEFLTVTLPLKYADWYHSYQRCNPEKRRDYLNHAVL